MTGVGAGNDGGIPCVFVSVFWAPRPLTLREGEGGEDYGACPPAFLCRSFGLRVPLRFAKGGGGLGVSAVKDIFGACIMTRGTLRAGTFSPVV